MKKKKYFDKRFRFRLDTIVAFNVNS